MGEGAEAKSAIQTTRISATEPAPMIRCSLGLVCALALTILSLSCSEVEHCQPGAPGCLNGPPTEGGVCRFNLVARNDVCIAPSKGNGGDNRPQPNPCGECPKGKTCTTDRELCVDFCEQTKPFPGSEVAPEPIRCGGEIKNPATGELYELDFDQTCKHTCQLACRLRSWFCQTGCAEDACEQPEVLVDCHSRCDLASDPLSCVQSLCNDTRGTGCSTTQGLCAGSEIPDCSAVECKNNCASTAYDGVCDDGDLFNAASGSCRWGSDCADCGPREGEDFSHELKQGNPCSLQEQCEGHSPDFAKNEAFCAQVVPQKPLSRCVLDCSSNSELCPVGSTCTTLRVADPDGGSKPLRDVNGVGARACLPDACL